MLQHPKRAGIIFPILQMRMLRLRQVKWISQKLPLSDRSWPQSWSFYSWMFTQFAEERQERLKRGTDTNLWFGESCRYQENFPQLGPQTRVLLAYPRGHHMKISILAWQEGADSQNYSTIFLCTLTFWSWLTLAHRSEMDGALAFLFSWG